MAELTTDDRSNQLKPIILLAALTGLTIYAYGNSLFGPHGTVSFWSNPKYSHGWLVPLFTLVLLWMRYQPIPLAVAAWERWCGVLLVGLGFAMRLTFTYFPSLVLEMQSFVLCLVGVFLLVGGISTLRWAGPAVLFLVFMFPLPAPLETSVLAPLQHLATNSSTYCLQTLGIPAYSEGNNILFNDVKMGVVEQCSGLRMLTIFIALSVAITLVTERPMWERIVIVLSAIPIALAVNIIRITVTGILHELVDAELANKVFHDLAGWVMMPMALGLLYVEFQILSHLLIEDAPSGPMPIGIGFGGGRTGHKQPEAL